MKKIRVGILFGGKSAEHEVSLRSARNVAQALDATRYEAVLIGVDKQGVWHLTDGAYLTTHTEVGSDMPHVVTLFSLELATVEVIFPLLHGPMGEDGTVQGLVKSANIPCVGADVLGSAIGMDKDVMKRLLREAGIPIAPFIVLRASHQTSIKYEDVIQKIGLPFFVKPANMGSSVGVSQVHTDIEFQAALHAAFQFDHKVILEATVVGNEIECAVLGNDLPRASLPGRVIPAHDFYDYEAKYLDDSGAKLEIPAKLPPVLTRRIQTLAIQVFRILECAGMGRVDLFLQKDGTLIVNEINTIPGFTEISMYPKLWEASGVAYADLITKVIDLALERHAAQMNLKTSYF